MTPRVLKQVHSMDLDGLLTQMRELNASDLFLKVPAPPSYKISGRITQWNHPPLTPQAMEDLAVQVLRPRDQERFQERNQVDFSYVVEGVGRFRGNCYRQ